MQVVVVNVVLNIPVCLRVRACVWCFSVMCFTPVYDYFTCFGIKALWILKLPF